MPLRFSKVERSEIHAGSGGCLTRLQSATAAVTRALETPEYTLVPASLGLGQQDAGATLRFASQLNSMAMDIKLGC